LPIVIGREGKRHEPDVREFGEETINISVNGDTLEKIQQPVVYLNQELG